MSITAVPEASEGLIDAHHYLLRGGKICVRFLPKCTQLKNVPLQTANRDLLRTLCDMPMSVVVWILFMAAMIIVNTQHPSAFSAKHGDTYKVTHYRIILIVFGASSQHILLMEKRFLWMLHEFCKTLLEGWRFLVNFAIFLLIPHVAKDTGTHKSARWRRVKRFTSFCAVLVVGRAVDHFLFLMKV